MVIVGGEEAVCRLRLHTRSAIPMNSKDAMDIRSREEGSSTHGGL
jgi:hypothetical protein